MPLDWAQLWVLGATAAVAALLGMACLTRGNRRGVAAAAAFADQGSAAVFLFDGEMLIDSTPSARSLLAGSVVSGGPWARLLAFLGPRYPDIAQQLLGLPAEGRLILPAEAAQGGLLLQAEHSGGLTRIALIDPKATALTGADPFAHQAMAEELAQLRRMMAEVPLPIWREDATGQITWANSCYLARATETLPAGQDLAWPLPRLFGPVLVGQEKRRKLVLGGLTRWYDLQDWAEGGGRTYVAQPSDSVVQAETALRDFMQTLTKTFAQLPIGLAIFDQQRRLHLFNPALLDLTGLPADFLSARPSLLAVLDALRDRKKLPEPKDYHGWRQQLLTMERAAASGLYEENWNLPDGQTYRVVGRPHPNGALALMIEDISTEMLRTRRYRAEVELGQAVIDAMEDAVAVFAQSGQVLMSNAAYAGLWGHDPAGDLADHSVRSLSARWRALSAPSPLWAEVEDYVATVGDRDSWAVDARLLDGRLLSCRFSPLASGATLAAFRPAATAEPATPRLTESTGLRRA